ncbi:hypothetical protein BH10ACI2_BH10ACI2_13930 [soil metagenome]
MPGNRHLDPTHFKAASKSEKSMKKSVCTGIFVFAAAVLPGFAQSNSTAPLIVPERIDAPKPASTPAPKVVPTPVPKPVATPIIVGQNQSTPATQPGQPTANSQASNLTYKGLSFSQIKAKIAEAKRQMQTRPLTTAMSEPVTISPLVRIAYYDWRDKNINYIVISKDAFLIPNYPTTAISSNGRVVTTTTIRANGVNTPLAITDETGQPQLPLMIQYPVEKNGKFIETAYYMSTHPGLVTPEVVSAGRFYVHNVIEIARDQLRTKGYFVQPRVADIAERLATVEHVDHLRFKTEFQPNIFNDIFTLYALNEGQTYRYSVSSAGAGGMVQMIPPTYRMVREMYPNAALMPDFVEGMRNHVNATQAMLLYMQMTWNDLASRPSVSNALATGIATQEQLMAAGYNSNPAKLAGYIDRGGANWPALIPQETKIYLQIYGSLERAVSLDPRKQ